LQIIAVLVVLVEKVYSLCRPAADLLQSTAVCSSLQQSTAVCSSLQQSTAVYSNYSSLQQPTAAYKQTIIVIMIIAAIYHTRFD
jgi:hypothetical protein